MKNFNVNKARRILRKPFDWLQVWTSSPGNWNFGLFFCCCRNKHPSLVPANTISCPYFSGFMYKGSPRAFILYWITVRFHVRHFDRSCKKNTGVMNNTQYNMCFSCYANKPKCLLWVFCFNFLGKLQDTRVGTQEYMCAKTLAFISFLSGTPMSVTFKM